MKQENMYKNTHVTGKLRLSLNTAPQSAVAVLQNYA